MSLLWIHGKREPLPFIYSQELILSLKRCSGFREEHSLVCHNLFDSHEGLT